MIGDELRIFCGSATPELAASVAQHLGGELSKGWAASFPDGETRVQIDESVRGADCYIVQYPGQVQVTVVRESRAVQYAR